VSEPLSSWISDNSKYYGNRIQSNIENYQNSVKDCSEIEKIKTLTCDFVKDKIDLLSCGFGCRIHFLMYCFMSAYYSKRHVIVMDSYHMNGAEEYMKPFSNVMCSAENINSYCLSKLNLNELKKKLKLILKSKLFRIFV
jgi:hypothetical protein